jgi:hypothetical protein
LLNVHTDELEGFFELVPYYKVIVQQSSLKQKSAVLLVFVDNRKSVGVESDFRNPNADAFD